MDYILYLGTTIIQVKEKTTMEELLVPSGTTPLIRTEYVMIYQKDDDDDYDIDFSDCWGGGR